jgi:NAD(P)-dependent dehydrogenase (short-subunit alcohol dehydrogenase family)
MLQGIGVGTVRVVISASSDIGLAVAENWVKSGHSVVGTFRNYSSRAVMKALKVTPVYCNLSWQLSAKLATRQILRQSARSGIECLLLSAGTQIPIGRFGETTFTAWRASVNVNFLAQLGIVRDLMPAMREGGRIIFFAGGGTNGATERYSAYTISKIASIKICELLAFEYPNLAFFSIGPGWIKTKIHNETLQAGASAGDGLDRTLRQLASGNMLSMDSLVSRINWLLDQEPQVVTGRNFSASNDPLGDWRLVEMLQSDQEMFKLRRHGNDLRLPTLS